MAFFQTRSRAGGLVSAVVLATMVVVAALLAPRQPAAATGAATLYVSTSGRNTNSCTQAAPCQSLGRAYQVARPGDVVQVAGGNYPTQTLMADATKTSSDDVVFTPAGAVTITGDLSLGTTSALGARHVTFRDFKVTGSVVTRPGADDATFERIDARNLNISGSGAEGVKVLGGDYGPNQNEVSHVKQGAQNVLIDGAVFHDFTVTDPANHSECLMIWGGAGRVTIRNSAFLNCTDFGILAKGASGSILIENSMLDEPMPGDTATASCNPGCPRGGNSIAFSDGSAYVVRYSSLLGGIRVDPEVSNVVLKGNVGPRGSCPAHVSYSFNVWSAAKCSASDRTAQLSGLFLGPSSSSFDLHLKAGSAAIGAGNVADHPSHDIAGRLRPATLAPDAGAWQWESALVVPGRALGTARIGMKRADVAAFYGAGRKGATQKLPKGVKVVVSEHKVRGGSLRVSYRDDVVIALATTSPYYRTVKGLTPGSPMRARANDDWTCRPVGGPKGKAGLYLRPTRTKTPVVAELIVVAARFTPLCAIPADGR